MTDDRVFVVWAEDEEKPDLEVRRACNRCYGNAVSVREIKIECVSRYGTAHAGPDGEAHDGETRCGIDATGPTWWWAY